MSLGILERTTYNKATRGHYEEIRKEIRAIVDAVIRPKLPFLEMMIRRNAG
jgi:hypothetical protein